MHPLTLRRPIAARGAALATLGLVLSGCWNTVEDATFGVRVKLPGDPQVARGEQMIEGVRAQVFTAHAAPDASRRALLAVWLLPSELLVLGPTAILDRVSALRDDGEGHTVEPIDTSPWQGRPALQIFIEHRERFTRHLFLVDGARALHLAASDPDERQATILAERIFASLRLSEVAGLPVPPPRVPSAEPDAAVPAAPPAPEPPAPVVERDPFEAVATEACPYGATRFEHRDDRGGRVERLCVDDAGKRQGPFVVTDPGGVALRVGHYADDQKIGRWLTRSREGPIELDESFLDDKPSGDYARSVGSQVVEQGRFRGGQRTGQWSWWDENGKRLREVTYRDGLRNGRETIWQATGERLSEGEYRDDRRQGRWTFWHPGGHKAAEGEYSDDQPVGTWQTWDAQGRASSAFAYEGGEVKLVATSEGFSCPSGSSRREQPSGQGTEVACVRRTERSFTGVGGRRHAYEVTVLDGPVRMLDHRGNKKAEGQYRDGQRDGAWKYYDPDGNLLRTERWQAGRIAR